MPGNSWPRSESTAWAYAIVTAALVLLLIEVVRGAVHELSVVASQTRQEQLRKLQSHSLEWAKGLEVLLQAHHAEDSSWSEIRQQPWLESYWSQLDIQPPQLYAAIVDPTGRIVVHTDPARRDRRLESGWYERKASEDGPDVYFARHSALSGRQPAYDATVPVQAANDNLLGEYHEALDADWLASTIAARQRSVGIRWLWVIALVSVIDLGAGGALVFLARTQDRLRSTVGRQTRRRTRELSQIGSGLAHEIRNPLHALRINLHTLRRSFTSRSPLPPDQLVEMIEQSECAIDQLDELMRDLVQFTDRAAGKQAEVDLAAEVKATLTLLADSFQQHQIALTTAFPQREATISIDPVRLRQLLLNVVTMAQHRAGRGGKIDVEVMCADGGAEVVVADSGSRLSEARRAQIFEPFQAPAETGSGLGLALVQVYVEEAGGRAIWDDTGASGRCRLWFPLAQASKGSSL
jgi:two-component system, NtrC family, sensor histidine kinase HydH